MSIGYVYVLFNPAIKGQVKIGKTTNAPETRAAELSTTGLPQEFVVAYAERVSDCDKVERLLHDKLSAVRVNPNREFFRLSVRDAIKAVLEVAAPYKLDEGEVVSTGSPVSSDILDEATIAGVRGEHQIRRAELLRARAHAQRQGK